MSKTSKVTPVDLEKVIMKKVKFNEISMKPRWYFVVGSLLTVAGLVGISIGAIFLTNLTLFLLKRHGPMGEWRLQLILNSFPWWIPVLAVLGIFFGIWLLKKYDFSYKKNFFLIILAFIVSIISAGYIIDAVGLNAVLSRQGPIRRFYHYQEVDKDDSALPRGKGQGRMRNLQ